jgi:hypothetical protein
MQAVVELGAKTDDGFIIQPVTLPWLAIVEALQRDPSIAYQLTPEQWEQMVARAYERRIRRSHPYAAQWRLRPGRHRH